MSKLAVVVGAQFGSEAKGHVTQRLTEQWQNRFGTPEVIRVAGPNAGHTGYDGNGNRWALRQVPVAAVTEGPVILGIAAGSEVDPLVLLDEVDRLTKAGLLDNKAIWVHGAATVISQFMINDERYSDLTKRLGSTSKGIGSARSARIWRTARTVGEDPALVEALEALNVKVVNTYRPSPITNVIIEGTQGYGLGLHTQYYPQVTSSDCRACDFMAMVGVHAWEFESVDVWAVARVYPIRVAGNSGPLKDETTWEKLGLPEEYTTVTKKVRRVGGEDWDLVAQAVRANGGSPTVKVALTMLDQKFPELAGIPLNGIPTAPDIEKYLGMIEWSIQAKIDLVTTGPDTATWR